MAQIKVYISAKIEHAAKLLAFQSDGFHSNARWIEMAESGRQRMKPVSHWQQENYDDIVAAHFFLLYAEPTDFLKGSLQEIGYAIGKNKKCWIAPQLEKPVDDEAWGVEYKIEGTEQSIRVPHKSVMPWGMYSQSVKMVSSVRTAFAQMRAYADQARILNFKGEVLESEVHF